MITETSPGKIWYLTNDLRGITRRKPDPYAPDGWAYAWAIQRRWHTADGETEWRDMPSVNEWEHFDAAP